MPELSSYYPRIRPHIDTLPSQVIDDTLRLVLRAICQKTRLWVDEEPLYITEGVNRYTLTPATGTAIDDVCHIELDDRRRIKSRPLPEYESRGRARLFSFDPASDTLTLWPTPDKTLNVTVRRILMPSLDATTVPDYIYSETATLAPYGVLAELQAGSERYGKEALINRQRYETELNQRRLRAFLSESKNNYVTPRRFI